MIEKQGDMFAEYLDPGVVYVITTNGYVKNNGQAVMGRGTAAIAAAISPRLPSILGDLLLSYGNKPYVLPGGFVTLPVKHRWDEKADLELIERSLSALDELLIIYLKPGQQVYLPRPGCGNGQLPWSAVEDSVDEFIRAGDWPVTVWSL